MSTFCLLVSCFFLENPIFGKICSLPKKLQLISFRVVLFLVNLPAWIYDLTSFKTDISPRNGVGMVRRVIDLLGKLFQISKNVSRWGRGMKTKIMSEIRTIHQIIPSTYWENQSYFGSIMKLIDVIFVFSEETE